LKIGLHISIATSASDLAYLIPHHVHVIVYIERKQSHVILFLNLKMIYRCFKRLVRDNFLPTWNQRNELMNRDLDWNTACFWD